MSSEMDSARFPTTAWTCVLAAKDPRNPQHQAAVVQIIKSYWRPVFHFLRVRGHPTDDAADLTQEFFIQMIEENSLRLVDRQKGRFRTFLLTLVKRCVYKLTIDAPRKERFEKQFVSITSLMNDDDRAYEPEAGETPEQAFNRQWKDDLFATVRRNMQTYYEGTSDQEKRLWFQIFVEYHLPESEKRPTQQELAGRLGVSRDAIREALDETLKRYERFIRQEVRDQIGSDEDVEDELRRLLNGDD